jgi:hypothetical protein
MRGGMNPWARVEKHERWKTGVEVAVYSLAGMREERRSASQPDMAHA